MTFIETIKAAFTDTSALEIIGEIIAVIAIFALLYIALWLVPAGDAAVINWKAGL